MDPDITYWDIMQAAQKGLLMEAQLLPSWSTCSTADPGRNSTTASP